MIYKGKILEDNHYLVDYGVQSGSVLNMSARLRGGGHLQDQKPLDYEETVEEMVEEEDNVVINIIIGN